MVHTEGEVRYTKSLKTTTTTDVEIWKVLRALVSDARLNLKTTDVIPLQHDKHVVQQTRITLVSIILGV